MAESIKAGRIEAAFMIAPLAMKLREEGVPVKILYLGHRDGSEVMVGKNISGRSLRDLRGKTFAIPSRYSNQNLVIHKLMEDQGVKPEEIKFVEMPPPDMPGALAGKAIDAYFVGEPFAAKAESTAPAGAVLRKRHLAAFHFLRTGGPRETDQGASRRGRGPGSRHFAERRMGGNPSGWTPPKWSHPTSGRTKN